MKHASVLIAAVVLLGCHPGLAQGAADSDGWIPLLDGEGLTGWKVGQNAESFAFGDGAIIACGPRAHLFYVGDAAADFKNFQVKVDVMTAPGTNSGFYFHTKYQESGWPRAGFEIQINNTQPRHGDYFEYKKTGSLYGIRNLYKSIVRDNEWFTMHIVVAGNRVRISLNGTLVVDYTEPAEADRQSLRLKSLARGTFALQCHDPGSKVLFKNILVKPLPDDQPDAEPPVVDDRYAQVLKLHRGNFPLVDFHVHLKGGLTLEEALANSRRLGINYGIAANCGVGFPITDDAGTKRYVAGMKGQPCFVGMQAEGREWVNTFSKEAVAQFDYAFSDSMTFTDHRGKRTRLWMKDEVAVDDKQAFMEMLVEKTVSVISNEPIDVYVNPTYLPAVIADEYDELWTDERTQKVIDAAARHKVAIEINAKLRLPKPGFIKRAKQAGAKFTFGTNNGGKELGRLEYCLDMIQECGLKPGDMFMPKGHGPE